MRHHVVQHGGPYLQQNIIPCYKIICFVSINQIGQTVCIESITFRSSVARRIVMHVWASEQCTQRITDCTNSCGEYTLLLHGQGRHIREREDLACFIRRIDNIQEP